MQSKKRSRNNGILLRDRWGDNAFMKKGSIHQPSDSLFKQSMLDIRVAKDFFQAHLPNAILEVVDLAKLKLENHSFIDEQYYKSESDIVYSAKTQDEDAAYFYLLCEQQSQIHPCMPFRLLKYQVRLLDQHLKQYRNSDLPIVYPMVVYSGEKRWEKSRCIFPYFGKKQSLAKSLWGAPFQLIDLHRMNDDEMRQRTWSGLMEFSLKYKTMRDFRRFLQRFLPWLDILKIEGDEQFGKIVLRYVLREVDETDKQIFIEETVQHSTSTAGGNAMTLAEQFRQEGREEVQQEMQRKTQSLAEQFRQEGHEEVQQEMQRKTQSLAEQFRQEGREEVQQEMQRKTQSLAEQFRQIGQKEVTKTIALTMLRNNMSIDLISEITGLDPTFVETLQEDIV